MKDSCRVIIFFVSLLCACGGPDHSSAETVAVVSPEPDSAIVAVPPDLDTMSAAVYMKYIDSLVINNVLETIAIPGSSTCGGDLEGYYQDGDLIFLSGLRTEEFGFTRRDCYFRDGMAYRIIETIHAPVPRYAPPQPDRAPNPDHGPVVYCDEIRTLRVAEREMTILRDGGEILYYPESHEHYIDVNIGCVEEMRKEINAAAL